ncbi:hypothetical protein THER_1487 [Thermodesulfovibrio sp. N1]|nr:hypothetical protein THER_1487 [Thermodesulfovibrio sp. N1]
MYLFLIILDNIKKVALCQFIFNKEGFVSECLKREESLFQRLSI